MSRRYRFLLTPRWLGWLALCVLFAVACSFLAQWQMDRREQALEEIDRVVSNYDAAPAPYSSVREAFVDPAADDEWTVVEMTGSYRPQDMRLVRNRSNGGSVGYEQLVPFAVAGTDDVVIVSRGWLPTASADGSRPATNPAPPEGTVELTVRLKPGEPAIDRGAPEGQLASIDLSAYAEQIGVELMPGAYGLMAEEDPAPAQAPEQLPRPVWTRGRICPTPCSGTPSARWASSAGAMPPGCMPAPATSRRWPPSRTTAMPPSAPRGRSG